MRGDAFSAEQKERNFAYYEALTVRDSSLSACTQAVVAAEVGQLQLAYDYLCESAFIDLDDLQHNTRDGLHLASLAGSWLGAVQGFGGMRDHGGVLSFVPRLPEALSRLRFRLIFRGRRLLVEVTNERASYSLIEGDALEIVHHGRKLTVRPGRPLTRRIPAQRARKPPTQPPGRAPAPRRPPR
jgi:alpha,alpha-trehalose phosphorylase